MGTLTPRLKSVFADAYNKLRTGELKTLIPFLSLFRLNGRPMNLNYHYQLAPMYGAVQPIRSVYMFGRQEGKSYGICSSTALRSMLVPFYHTVLVQPRADQIQRLIATVYRPLVSSCPIREEFISNTELAKSALREFNNGSLCYAEHMYESADRLRGISGAATCIFDESISENETILCKYNLTDNEPFKKKISDIKQGDIICSWSIFDGSMITSIAAKDASYHGIRRCFKISACGHTVTCTADHKLRTNTGDRRVSDLIMDTYPWNGVRVRTKESVDKLENELIAILSNRPEDGFAFENVALQLANDSVYGATIDKIEYVGELPVYDIEVVGTHNYVLGSGICSFNCQDLEYEFLDIASETMSASLFWGFSVYTGTPKTTDTTLALLWNQSSQAEWVTRCEHCNYFNIPNPDHDLIKMIGKEGPVCAKCGKPIYPSNGGYVHAYAERMRYFPGYHIPQTIHPLHTSHANKWQTLVDKVNRYPKLTLWNEVFGWPIDEAISPLTLADLMKATHDIKIEKPSDIERIIKNYRYITVAVDWSGGGMISDSYTSYAVLGFRLNSDIIDVLYGKRIKKGVSPTDEAHELMHWIVQCGADAFAYDNGGAGFTRLEIMKQAGLMNIPNITVVPINYVAPRSGDVMRSHPAEREPDLYYYSLDKSRSLAVCITAIKSKRVLLPKFAEDDESTYQRDFLALREDPSESARSETVILIKKKPGVPDDFAHAVNFGCSQIWDHFGAYPRIGTRYDTSYLNLDENGNSLDVNEPLGPRGDFERFSEAVNVKTNFIETEDLMYENQW